MLFPASIDEYIGKEHPVRVYDAFIDLLRPEDIELEIVPNKVGNSAYEPKAMLKLLVYGYSYGIKSSRKLERAVHENVSFIWLMGNLKPDHKTISEFRRNNKRVLKKVLGQCARMCIKLGLIDGNILFVDGTKIRANGTRNRNYSNRHYKEALELIEKRIEELLNECERIDEAETDTGSLVRIKEELMKKGKVRNQLQEILKEFQVRGETNRDGTKRTVNQTDPDSALMRSIQGSHAS
jgi:transposase